MQLVDDTVQVRADRRAPMQADDADHDPEEPGTKGRLLAERREPAVRREEHLLDDVLHGALVDAEPAGAAVHEADMLVVATNRPEGLSADWSVATLPGIASSEQLPLTQTSCPLTSTWAECMSGRGLWDWLWCNGL